MKNLLIITIMLILCGCATQIRIPPTTMGAPENAKNYGYHPLDPLPVEIQEELRGEKVKILDAMPDETMRIAVGTVTGNSGIAFGPAKTGVEGKNYVVVLDYIKFCTSSFGVMIVEDNETKQRVAVIVDKIDGADIVVPVYIGVGLRLTANIYIKKGSVDLGSLFALGIAAKAEQITGTLVIQTLGVSGPEISGLIPMPGEISETSIQNAILALASIKAKIYDIKTNITPRIVGVYNNLGGGEDTINGFISSLLQKRLIFP